MPAAPELNNRGCGVGLPKVRRQSNSQHVGSADGHVGITAEVAVNLHGKSMDREQVFPATGLLCGRIEYMVDRSGDNVREHQFLCQADCEQGDAEREPRVDRAAPVRELRQQFVWAQNWPGDQMREKQYVGQEFLQSFFDRKLRSVRVYDIRAEREGHERNTER